MEKGVKMRLPRKNAHHKEDSVTQEVSRLRKEEIMGDLRRRKPSRDSLNDDEEDSDLLNARKKTSKRKLPIRQASLYSEEEETVQPGNLPLYFNSDK